MQTYSTIKKSNQYVSHSVIKTVFFDAVMEMFGELNLK